MSDFNNDDIDKIFEQIISSDEMDEINLPSEGIIGSDKVSVETLLKELVFISQSLARSINHIGELTLNYMSIDDYSIDDEIREILGNIYKLSEDFDECMIELILEDVNEDNEDNLEEDE